MAEEFDKNEDATPFKLDEARKKGQVAKSTELPSFFSLLAMIATMVATLGSALQLVLEETNWWILNAHYMADNPSITYAHFISLVSSLGKVILPIILAGLIAAIVANIVHVGPLFSMFPLKPDFSKINPAKGFKKVFSRRSLVELAKLIVKLVLFISVTYMVFKHISDYMLTSKHAAVSYVLVNWKRSFVTFSFAILGAFLVSALFDLWYSKKDFAREMRMSKRDVKDEHKRREGDPEIKAKRKRKLTELLNTASSMQHIKDADVIITNPTHVAVALRYRSASMALPVVVSRGRGVLAQTIKLKARKHGVPIMRKPSLARALVKHGRIGDPIPIEMQVKIADIYRWVLSIPGNKVHQA